MSLRVSSIVLVHPLNAADQPSRQSPERPDRDDEFQSWIQRAKDGDSEALGRMIVACRGNLLSIAQQLIPLILRSKFDPADLVQETSLDAHRAFSAFLGTTHGEFQNWMRRILLNNVALVRREYEQSQKRRIHREMRMDFDTETMESAANPEMSPSAWLILREQGQRLEECLSRLPLHMQQAIHLRSHESLSFAEIGQRLGRSEGAARKLWGRAIKRLKRELLHHGR